MRLSTIKGDPREIYVAIYVAQFRVIAAVRLLVDDRYTTVSRYIPHSLSYLRGGEGILYAAVFIFTSLKISPLLLEDRVDISRELFGRLGCSADLVICAL